MEVELHVGQRVRLQDGTLLTFLGVREGEALFGLENHGPKPNEPNAPTIPFQSRLARRGAKRFMRSLFTGR